MVRAIKILPPEGQGPIGQNNTIETPHNSGLFLQNIHEIHIYIHGSGQENVAVLLPGFAINW